MTSAFRRTTVLALALCMLMPASAGARSHGRILATGDSMIEILDGFIAQEVRPQHFKVRFDDHIDTGITKPFLLDWVAHLRRLAPSYRPTASVVFIGANDGYPLPYGGRQRPCCSRAWRKAYALRAQSMMRSLEQGGSARVYWLTLPAARPGDFNHIYKSVNLAVRAAARREGDGVRLIDMGRVFTPTGRFQSTIVRGGHRVSVRQADGIHLSVAGARIAAQVVVRHMRRDHLFR